MHAEPQAAPAPAPAVVTPAAQGVHEGAPAAEKAPTGQAEVPAAAGVPGLAETAP